MTEDLGKIVLYHMLCNETSALKNGRRFPESKYRALFDTQKRVFLLAQNALCHGTKSSDAAYRVPSDRVSWLLRQISL